MAARTPRKAAAARSVPAVVSLASRRLADLEALRVALLASLDEAALPAVSKELRAVNAEIAELTKGVEVSGVDELRAKRDKRRAGAPSAVGTGRGSRVSGS